ncbi:glucose-specific phosphotransferase system enzyme II%2C factor IIA [Staphylococcus aureus]|nr:glucose-specific phosphotransferase system enzyme II%2C factor IIA [Staphylococcus aureus]
MKVDLDYIKQHADSTITPIVITNLDNKELEILETGSIEQGDKLLVVK